jgi:hypothetical protein
MNLIRESASAKRDEALLLSQKADAMETAAKATGGYTAEEREAVAAMRDAAEMAGLVAKRMDVDARAKRDALEATRALANQQRVLSEEFGKAGATGVRSMDDVRRAIDQAASGGEIDALGRALQEAFQKAVLSADEYKQALDQVLEKTRDLKDENESRKSVVDFERLFEQYGTDVGRVRRASPGDRQGVVAKAYAKWLEAKRRAASGESEPVDTRTAEGYFKQEAEAEAARRAQQEAQQAKADAEGNSRRPAFRTVRVELVSGGKTTHLDLPEGQDNALLDAIRRSGLAAS